MKKYTVEQGRHDFKPDTLCVYWRPRGIDVKCKFIDCDYDLVDEDQQDWNKLVGLTYSLNPLKKTVMVGWRWNKEKQLVELNAYYHINGIRTYTETLASVKLWEDFLVRILVHKDSYHIEIVTWSSSGNRLVARHSQPHHGDPTWIARMINPWFGGNEAAPKKMSLELEVNKI